MKCFTRLFAKIRPECTERLYLQVSSGDFCRGFRNVGDGVDTRRSLDTRLEQTFSTSKATNGSKGERIGVLMEKWRKKLEDAAVTEPLESVEHIFAHSLETRRVPDLYKRQDELLEPRAFERISKMCNRRLEKVPVQYIIGEWDFRRLTLKMAPPVFIPRPETENLVDLVLNEIGKESKAQVLEICCGSGAISLALLDERPEIDVTAVDRSAEACALTIGNADRLKLRGRLRVIRAEMSPDSPLPLPEGETFDIIVSNPPYVFSEDLENVQDEIKLYEDPRALDGGQDGLDVIRLVLEEAERRLVEGGKLFLEVDPRHPPMLSALVPQKHPRLGFRAAHRDFCGKLRFVEVHRIN